MYLRFLMVVFIFIISKENCDILIKEVKKKKKQQQLLWYHFDLE